MTTNEETNGTPKKRTRKTAEALPPPPPETTEASGTVESGDAQPSADAAAQDAPSVDPAKDVTWNDVVAASAERDANEWRWDEAEDLIPVKLTDTDKARLIEQNGVDQAEKDAVDAKIDALKEQIKARKAEADVILARTEERNRAASAGIEQRRGPWKIGTCFALNTVRYVDPATGLTVYERAIESHERQVSLPLVSEEAAAKAAQLSLGDVEPTDDTTMTDPEALLAAAQQGEAAESDEDPGDDEQDDDGGEDEGEL